MINNSSQKLYKRNINGILLLDKPQGITSNKALQKVKHLFKAKKAGHTGSLDPLATGLLPLCFGEATKFSQFLLDADKHYEVTIQLGETTTTGDSEGEITATKPVPPLNRDTLLALLHKFVGWIEQIPPMYSAIKQQGQPLYKLARQGIEVEREPRPIQIHAITLNDFTEDTLTLEVFSSKGCYIRTLAMDIGQQLGCGAHVRYLRRQGVAHYHSDQSYSLAALEALAEEQKLNALDALLQPIDGLINHWPAVNVSATTAHYLFQGQSVLINNSPASGWVRLLLGDQQFIGIGEVENSGKIAPKRLINRHFVS